MTHIPETGRSQFMAPVSAACVNGYKK